MVETKKYKFTGVSRNYRGYRLYEIEALKDFGYVKKGQVGGMIHSEENLSQTGNCWVTEDVYVIGDAKVEEDAYITGSVTVQNQAIISGKIIIRDSLVIAGDTVITGEGILEGSRVIENGYLKLNVLTAQEENGVEKIKYKDEFAQGVDKEFHSENHLAVIPRKDKDTLTAIKTPKGVIYIKIGNEEIVPYNRYILEAKNDPRLSEMERVGRFMMGEMISSYFGAIK